MVLATKAVMTTNLILKFNVLLACIYYCLKIVHYNNIEEVQFKQDDIRTILPQIITGLV